MHKVITGLESGEKVWKLRQEIMVGERPKLQNSSHVSPSYPGKCCEQYIIWQLEFPVECLCCVLCACNLTNSTQTDRRANKQTNGGKNMLREYGKIFSGKVQGFAVEDGNILYLHTQTP